MEIRGLDYVTGEEKKKVSIAKLLDNTAHHHRCYPNKSTTRYFISGRRGAEFTDYQTGEVTLNHWARGACRYGLMPAKGLLYKLPDPCTCHLQAKILGFYALASEKSAENMFSVPAKNPVHKGSAFGSIPNETFSSASEWPQYRHDPMRSSSVKTTVSDKIKKLWEINIGGRLTPPVIGNGRVYVSSIDEHKINVFKEENGEKLWTHIAGGRVDSPPAVYKGMVLFGSTDGWVTCLRAEDGAMAWRFRAAPYERMIMAYDQVESAWPVHGSVLVINDVAYCTAGRSSFLDKGIFLYTLNATTGKLLGTGNIHEIQTEDRKSAKTMPEQARGAGSSILVTDGINIYMRDRKLDFSVPIKKGKDDFGPC